GALFAGAADPLQTSRKLHPFDVRLFSQQLDGYKQRAYYRDPIDSALIQEEVSPHAHALPSAPRDKPCHGGAYPQRERSETRADEQRHRLFDA
ncbi:MAG: hypothetical protein VX475_23240, partial [Myxococcota bacterium]|nr:hypothetical protein [Myxococcota bacterium]